VNSEKLAVNSVIAEKIADGAVTRPKLGYKAVSVTIPAGELSGDSGPDPELVDGQILGFYPSAGNSPVQLRQIILSPLGSVSVSIWAGSADENTFDVVILRSL
jgi:hypothetical protein